MSLRTYLQKLAEKQALTQISLPVSPQFEAAGLLKALEPEAVLLEQVTGSNFRLAGNLFCTKAAFASYFDLTPREIIPALAGAIDRRTACPRASSAACQEVVNLDPDLEALPILRHCTGDGGNYISAGVFITRHPEHGQNLDFHRAMQLSKNELAVRVVRGRHFDTFLNELGEMEVAICIGLPPNVLAAAATSVALGIDELEIANALEPVPLVQGKTVDLLVPAEAELVIEGRIFRDRRHAEGPFVDLTETYDAVRQEPVMVVKAITHQRDAIWQALLPGGLEHRLLMGMPREPTIFQQVNQVVRCLDVHINPGGCSWLHAIVQIDKQTEQDGKKAIAAAFAGHRSCKHVFVVDADIDIYDPLQVEWALATRFQGDEDLVILPKEPGSSLDPSAEPGTYHTTKMGFDLTRPLAAKGKDFNRAKFPKVDVKRFIR